MSRDGERREVPLDLGQQRPQTILHSQNAANAAPAPALDKHQIDYDLIVKPNLDAIPEPGQIFLDENSNDQKIAYKVKDLDGKMIRESLDLTNLEVVRGKLRNNKLIQDAINTDKKIILEAIKANTAAKIFKDAKALADAQKAEEQTALAKELKTRQDKINNTIQNSRSQQESSNLSQMQHLTGMSMEGLAVKMIIEEIAWILKSLFLVRYFEDSHHYNELLNSDPSLVYDLSQTAGAASGPNNKPLYSFTFVKDKIVLDKTKLIEVETVDGKLRLKDDYKPAGYSDAMIIMANGYLPPPTVLASLYKEFSDYVQKQVESVLDPQNRAIEANFYNQLEEKDKPENKDDAEATRERLIAQQLASRPAPRPSGGK